MRQVLGVIGASVQPDQRQKGHWGELPVTGPPTRSPGQRRCPQEFIAWINDLTRLIPVLQQSILFLWDSGSCWSSAELLEAFISSHSCRIQFVFLLSSPKIHPCRSPSAEYSNPYSQTAFLGQQPSVCLSRENCLSLGSFYLLSGVLFSPGICSASPQQLYEP